MSKIVSIDAFPGALKEELTLYNKGVTEGIKRQTHASMEKLVKETKATAPVGHRKRHYKNKIRSRVEHESAGRLVETWYVGAPDYRLSHLLNNGHAKRNGRGGVAGTGFITKAYEGVRQEYEKKVEEIIKNG